MSGTYNTSHGHNQGVHIQAGVVHASMDLHQRAAKAIRIVPQRETTLFQNRTDELAGLDAHLDHALESEQSLLLNLVGPPGIGKTTTALTWILRNRRRFGHAQLAVACGGDPGEGQGRGIEELCDQYLHAVGVDTDAPGLGTLQGKLNRFHREIAEQPVVVLLDDVRTAAQVQPFLSDLAGMVVVVTSREPVPGLAQRRPVVAPLGPLGDEAVEELLRDLIGDERPVREPEAFTRLVRLCAGVPLLAGHTGGLLSDEPALAIADLVARMEDTGRLAHLEEAARTATRPAAVFDVFYRELDPDARLLYRALGVHPTRDFDRWLARAVFPGDADQGDKALDVLLRRSLVKVDWAGRYVMEDLTYEHARLVAEGEEPAERREVHRRFADYYLFGAVAADKVRTDRWRVSDLYRAEAPCSLPDFAATKREAGSVDLDAWLEHRRHVRERSARQTPGVPSPDEWFEANMDAILAFVQRSGRVWQGTRPEPGYAWRMAEATNGYFTANGRVDERLTLLALAERDAEGNDDALARVLAQRGEAMLGQGRLTEARTCLERSLAAARGDGADPRGQGAALEWLGILGRREGDVGAARAHLEESLPLLDHTRPKALGLHHMHMGDVALLAEEPQRALEYYRTSLSFFREHAASRRRDHANEGKLLVNQARVIAEEHPDQAVGLLEEALERFVTADRAYQAGKVLERLGELGRNPRERWGQALEVFELVGAVGAARRVREKLDGRA
ncbi:hypothetical protein [Nocardiopsis sp. JB363]|uniref:hypothetical protein n=1 Tax=Nocardiopsis sp. JB363 TaxID=1434837 RepID=UPI00097A6A28|nr:hypothetical protein [Nocardiopsis sp. JB363]SIO87503.1 transcriptional regulator, SARP family [Nocardiopsis sp. JB363]